MVASQAVGLVLLHHANMAQLLPHLPPGNRSWERRGALSLSVSDNDVVGQPLPSIDHTWIEMAPFEHLTTAQREDTKLEKDGLLATILRRRMCFIVLFVELATTHKCDWQRSFPTNLEPPPAPTAMTSGATHYDRFDWSRVLRKLTVGTQDDRRALAALRWGQPRFLIQCAHGAIPDHFPAMLETFLTGPMVDCTRSKWFQPPLHALMWEEAFRLQSRHRIVELGLSFNSGRMTTSLVARIIEVLERFGRASSQVRKCSSKYGGISIEFRVTSFVLGSRCLLREGALEALSQHVRDSKHLFFKEITLARVALVEFRDLRQWLTNVALPVTSNALNGKVKRGFRGLKTLVLGRLFEDFSRVGSLVRCGSSTEELSVWYSIRDLDALAAWLAFGFFHVDSSSRVSTLRLRMIGTPDTEMIVTSRSSCTQRFTDIFRRVLTQVVSSEDLAPLHPKTTATSAKRKRDDPEYESPLDEEPLPHDKRVFVEVAAKTKARAQPSVRSAVVATLSDGSGDQPSTEQFQVIRRLREWLAVVVAGAGAGWIPRKAVVKESTLPTRLIEGRLTNGRVTSFTWEGGSSPVDDELKRQHCTVLVDLLESIGSQLEVLQYPNHRLESNHFASIVERCPNLTALNLFGNCIDDVAPLVDAYEQGRCKIASLSIAQRCQRQGTIIQQVTKLLELCQVRNGGARAVRRPAMKQLVVRFSSTHDLTQNQVGAVAAALNEAVRKSRQLEFTRMLTDNPTEMQSQWRAVREASSKSKSNPRVTRPLALSSKLSMLSVVHSKAWRPSQLSVLDARVLSLIFSFARSCQPPVYEIGSDGLAFR